MDGNGFRVMTYHQFGWEYVNQVNFLQDIELIICDEMHNLIKYKGIENSRNKTSGSTTGDNSPCHIALDVLTAAARDDCAPMIVVMTATVNAVSIEFDRRKVPCSYFDYTGKAHCDLTRHRHFYAHFEDVISQLPSNTRAIHSRNMRRNGMGASSPIFGKQPQSHKKVGSTSFAGTSKPHP